MKLAYDICRCNGQLVGYTCPRREDCARYLARGTVTSPWVSIPYADFLCDDYFDFQIPVERDDDGTTRVRFR